MDFPIDPPKLKSLTSIFFRQKDQKQSMQGSPPPPLEPGLKTLTTPLDHNRSLSCKKPNILSFSSTSSSSSCLSSMSSPPSPSPSTSALMDEVKDHREEKEEAIPCHAAIDNPDTNADGNGNHNDRSGEEEEEEGEEEDKPTVAPQVYCRRRRSFHEEREFPPPIPHLARTGNLPCHMPWVLKRSYTDNGRLVIQEVKVKHHEYFRARRANGRLTLQIMQLDESATSLPLRPASPNDSTEITDKTDENLPSSPSTPSSPFEAEGECNNVKLNAPVETSRVPSLSPSSLPPPPSMLSKELKNILDVNRGTASQGNSSNRDEKNTRDVMEMGALPSILSSSMPESSFGTGGGGGGGGCCLNNRSTSFFSTPVPTIRPVHS